MRFLNKNYISPNSEPYVTKRVVKKFLFFPRRFNTRFTRWLEYADIIEVVTPDSTYNIFYWEEIGFADE